MEKRIPLAALALAAWTVATGQDAKIKPGCELLTAEEVAAAARSGPVVILTVENADIPTSAERLLGRPPVGGRVPARFSLLKVEAFGNGRPRLRDSATKRSIGISRTARAVRC